MECNKDEAVRVAGIAELKFEKGDLVGAKRFILKALKLYPCLDDAIQLSAVLDVHIAAQVKVGINEPEPDYYGILQVKPLSDDSTIKKQYRNLSKLVHPNKSKESMKEKSEAAFKLIAKAFGVLSDKETRFQYDLKRGEKPTVKEPPIPTYSTHQPRQRDVKRGGTPRANPQPQQEPRKQEPPRATYSANQPRHQAAAQPTPAPGAQTSQAPYTFWTACPICRMQYQYNRIYLDNQVVCQKCHSSFPANDINVHPSNGASAFVWPPTSPAPGAQASQAPGYTFSAPASPGAQASQVPNTFLTACPICRMQYQCMSFFLNSQVVCQKCNSSFPANDINAHPANGASAYVWPPGPVGNNNSSLPASGASAFVWPAGLSGNNNPFPAGTSWYEMFQNHLAPPYGASTNGTSWNDILLSMFSGGNPVGGYGNNSSPTQFCLSMLLSAMNLS